MAKARVVFETRLSIGTVSTQFFVIFLSKLPFYFFFVFPSMLDIADSNFMWQCVIQLPSLFDSFPTQHPSLARNRRLRLEILMYV